jgi:hypothetical protein
MDSHEKNPVEPKHPVAIGSYDGGMSAIIEAFGIDPHKLYPIEHVANLLSVDKKLVRWWIKKGSIEGIKLPNRAWRIRGIEIIRMLEQGRSRTR